MDYEKAYKEAEMRADEAVQKGCLDKELFDIIFPPEDEDERIRKALLDYILKCAITPESKTAFVAYLEKQKERPSDAKLERVIRASRRVLNNWLDGGDNPDVSGDFTELEHAIREYDGEEKQKEQKPNIELIQRSWYMEGYHDREFGKEPKWIIKTGEGGPEYELNPKYGQPLAKEQKPAENYLEWRNIVYYVLKEWLGIGQYMDMFPFNDIVKTLQERYSLPKPAEWSEGNEEMIINILSSLRGYICELEDRGCKSHTEYIQKEIDWLKSLRPSWKPSKEQMKVLLNAEGLLRADKRLAMAQKLAELYEQLKKL